MNMWYSKIPFCYDVISDLAYHTMRVFFIIILQEHFQRTFHDVLDVDSLAEESRVRFPGRQLELCNDVLL